MTEIRLSQKAKHDLMLQRAYLLDTFGEGKLKSFDNEIRQCMTRLEQKPDSFPLFPGQQMVRIIRFHRLMHIYYEYDEIDNAVNILRFYGTRQNPVIPRF